MQVLSNTDFGYSTVLVSAVPVAANQAANKQYADAPGGVDHLDLARRFNLLVRTLAAAGLKELPLDNLLIPNIEE